MRMFDMANDSGLFRTKEDLERDGFELRGNRFVLGEQVHLPLYEAKMMHQFDHRFATYTEEGKTRDVTLEEKANPSFSTLPRYWVPQTQVDERVAQEGRNTEWGLAYRWITHATNERTTISSILPKSGVGNSAPISFPVLGDERLCCILHANLNAFVLDYVARQKLGGANLTFGTIKQLAVLAPSAYAESQVTFVLRRVLELCFTDVGLDSLALSLGYSGKPFIWNEERRFWLRVELDALYFHLYGISRDDVDYIMETFPIVKRKDEAKYGCYRTKLAILEVYDEMARCRAEGREYQSRLDPPPAHPSLAHDASTRPEWA